MSPPIREGSGSSIESIRLGDGSEISEVRTGAGDVLFSAIPDATVSRYNTLLGFSQSDEGTSVSSWSDEENNHNISTNVGDASVVGSGINGNRSLDVRGDNVEFQTTSPSITQPFSVICLVEYTPTDTSTFSVPYDNGNVNGGSSRTQIGQGVGSSSGSDQIDAGSDLSVQDTQQAPVILSARFDGGNSLGRAAVDGATDVVEATGDAGTQDSNGWTLGSASGGGFYEGYLGVYLIVDDGLSSNEFAEQEQRLAVDFDFTGDWT